MRLEILEAGPLERDRVGRCQHHLRSLARLERLGPAGRAQTPLVAGLEALGVTLAADWPAHCLTVTGTAGRIPATAASIARRRRGLSSSTIRPARAESHTDSGAPSPMARNDVVYCDQNANSLRF